MQFEIVNPASAKGIGPRVAPDVTAKPTVLPEFEIIDVRCSSVLENQN
jgi:hypothetical protein